MLKHSALIAGIALIAARALAQADEPDPQRRLIVALIRQDEAGVREAVTAGADVNDRANPPLHKAAGGPTPEMLKLLVELGAQVEAAEAIDSALRIAIEHYRPDNAMYLLEKGAKPDRPNIEGVTSFYQAVAFGQSTIVKRMLDMGVKWDDRNAPMSHLLAAVGSGNWDTFELIRPRYPDLTIKDRYGRNALHHVAMATRHDDRARITNALLDAGVDPHLQTRPVQQGGGTPLRLALEREVDVAEVLVDRVRYEPRELNRCLVLAVGRGRLSLLKKLIEKGASVKDAARPGAGSTPLHQAVLTQEEPVIRYLLEIGHPIDSPVRLKNRTALHQAVVRGRADIVQLLLQHGADPTLKDADGNDATALARIRQKNGQEREFGGRIDYQPENYGRPGEPSAVLAVLAEPVRADRSASVEP